MSEDERDRKLEGCEERSSARSLRIVSLGELMIFYEIQSGFLDGWLACWVVVVVEEWKGRRGEDES